MHRESKEKKSNWCLESVNCPHHREMLAQQVPFQLVDYRLDFLLYQAQKA